LDHDGQPGNGKRVVQLTPPGSSCSIVIGTGMGEISAMKPGSLKGLHLRHRPPTTLEFPFSLIKAGKADSSFV
jgi:hypothetical protein